MVECCSWVRFFFAFLLGMTVEMTWADVGTIAVVEALTTITRNHLGPPYV